VLIAGLAVAIGVWRPTESLESTGSRDNSPFRSLGGPAPGLAREVYALPLVPITCHKRMYGWARPSLDEMRATTFKVPRFLNDGVLFPPLFAMYLSHIFYIEVPWANSARIEPGAMSGRSASAAGTEKIGGCRYEPSRGPTEAYSEFWLADYRPVEVRILGGQAVIRVEPDPGTFQTFDIERPGAADPKSPAKTPVVMPAPLSLIRVVDESGRLLFEQDGTLNWWELDGSGRLIVAQLDSRSEVPPEPRLDGTENRGELAVYPSGNASGPVTLRVLDQGGTALATYGPAVASKQWQRLFTFTLPAMPVTLRLDPGASILILPATQELP
jgi:hypothetical protein